MPKRYMQVEVPPPTLREGFRAIPADNGGWIVQLTGNLEPGAYIDSQLAFTTSQDMVAFLAQQLAFAPVG